MCLTSSFIKSFKSAWVSLDLSVFELGGTEAEEWLQGQITNDLRGVKLGGITRILSTCFCNQKGHIQFDGFLIPKQDKWLVLISRGKAPLFEKRVMDYVVAEDVSCVLRHYNCWVVFDDESLQVASEQVILISDFEVSNGIDDLVPYFTKGALLVLLEADFQPNCSISDSDSKIVGLRLKQGFPDPNKYSESILFPQELGLTYERTHVSFQKGCYLGQEVIMRIHSKGNVHREWVRVISDTPFQIGEKLYYGQQETIGMVLETGQVDEQHYIGSLIARRVVLQSLGLGDDIGPRENEDSQQISLKRGDGAEVRIV